MLPAPFETAEFGHRMVPAPISVEVRALRSRSRAILGPPAPLRTSGPSEIELPVRWHPSRTQCPPECGGFWLPTKSPLETHPRQRRREDLAKYALQEAEHEQMRMRHVQWAILVLHGIHTGSVAKKELELNPEAAETDYVWFLPEPGELVGP